MDMEEGDNVFAILKARRNEEEQCLEFLDRNRKVVHAKCDTAVDQFFNDTYANYLYKRVRRPADPEIELKAKFKKTYSNKETFIKNRIARNEEYVIQRKRDFAVSQERVKRLLTKLKQEYEADVAEKLSKCQAWSTKTEDDTHDLINNDMDHAAEMICQSAINLSVISNALSYLPPFYSSILKLFNSQSILFDKDSPMITEFEFDSYFKPLRPETQRLFISMSEACEPESMTPLLVERRGHAVCVISKPLVFNEMQCNKIASSLGWKAIFATKLKNAVNDIFEQLSKKEEDVIIFGFPRTPKELNEIFQLFNPIKPDHDQYSFLQRPTPSVLEPFDKIIELDISDEIVLRDVLAQLEDQETGSKYDIRTLKLETEGQLVNLHRISDPYFDIIQYPSRSVTMKANFDLIREKNEDKYSIVPLSSRELTDDLISQLKTLVNEIPQPAPSKYSPDATYPSLIQSVRSLNDDLRAFFMEEFKSIESSYNESIKRSFDLLNSIHLLLINHLEKARSEMQDFLRRPGSSQYLVIEFQEWHNSQVERSMRRLQKVKDECGIRLNALRDSLIQIENDRKSEEEQKQKDLLNAPFRTTLFEHVSNCCTMLIQAEIDRWVSTRTLMMDLNNVICDTDLVPPLPRKKLNMLADPSRDKNKKNTKKNTRSTPTSNSRNRADSKLQLFESPLFEQLESLKKYITDASVIYIRSTTPVSTRGKQRAKDKNPFAAHKISAIEELMTAFSDDDIYIISKIDQIAEMTRDEVQIVQQSFDAFLDDSTSWIQSNYEKRKSIADTAIAYMLKCVNEEKQMNSLIIMNEEQCTVDNTQLIVGNEEVPKVPAVFPEDLMHKSLTGQPEEVMNEIVDFISQDNNVQ